MINEARNWRISSRKPDLLLLLSILVCLVPGLLSTLLEEERKATFLTAAVGEAVAFNCQLEFPHDVVIPYVLHWKKEGQTVFSWYEGVLTAKDPFKGRVRLLPPESGYGRGSINLTNIRESDGGWYECKVYFPNRTPPTRHNGTWFHLTVDGGNLIAIPPINQTAMEGESAHFPCVTKDKTSIVVWMKDGIPLSELQHNLTVRSFVSADGSLTISPTDMGDYGEFICEVTNTDGEKQTARAFLDVQYKAKVIYSPTEVYLPFGRPALLDCHFRANPPLTNLRWEKDGFLFDPYNVQGVFYRRNGSLYFSKVDETHGGHYTCTPFNDLGTEGPSPIMNVIVQKPPVFTITPHNLYLRRKGDSVEMPCDAIGADGNHKPTVIWFKELKKKILLTATAEECTKNKTATTVKARPALPPRDMSKTPQLKSSRDALFQKDGNPLPSGRTVISGGNLTLQDIREDDRGIYQCAAFNEAATITAESELMVENVAPRAPYNVSAETTKDSVTVRWKSGFTKPKLEFSVWYRLAEFSDWKSLPAISRDVREITIDKLLPGREYEIMVLSQDVHGDGMFSKSIKVKTQGQTEIDSPVHQYQRNTETEVDQINSPRNINVALTSEGWLVTWDPPDNGAEYVDHYTVRWSQGKLPAGSADTTNTFFLVKDLEEDETYHFQVFVVSKNDFQAESSKFLVHTPSYRKVRAVSLGLGLGFIFLIALVLIAWFVRRHYHKKRLSENAKRDRISISS